MHLLPWPRPTHLLPVAQKLGNQGKQGKQGPKQKQALLLANATQRQQGKQILRGKY